MLLAGADFGQMMNALGKVGELHVSFDVLAPPRDRFFRCLTLFVCVRKALLDTVANR